AYQNEEVVGHWHCAYLATCRFSLHAYPADSCCWCRRGRDRWWRDHWHHSGCSNRCCCRRRCRCPCWTGCGRTRALLLPGGRWTPLYRSLPAGLIDSQYVGSEGLVTKVTGLSLILGDTFGLDHCGWAQYEYA